MKTLLYNIGLLATPTGRNTRSGKAQGEILFLKDAWILLEGNRILSTGTGTPPPAEQHIDAGNRLVTPGLVDAHTHLIFGGWRHHELGMKLHGAGYLEILAAGGGIHSTVSQTHSASEDALIAQAQCALEDMLHLGTTTAEVKSGYGLSTAEELKQLRAIRALKSRTPIELVPTFMGAHALPPAFQNDREGYLRLLCEEMIPAVAAEGLAEYCDVFCETGVFTTEEAERVLRAGLKYNLLPKIHADEIDAIGGSCLAGKLPAVSAEHLIVCPPDGITALAQGGVIACLLPATSLYLGATFAPALDMIHAGIPVALATDFNPGSCPCNNLQLVINLGCLKYRMTPEEVLTAVTLNAAAAVGRAEGIGTLEAGKQADILLWDAPDWNFVCYRMGSNLVHQVIKNGQIVHTR